MADELSVESEGKSQRVVEAALMLVSTHYVVLNTQFEYHVGLNKEPALIRSPDGGDCFI